MDEYIVKKFNYDQFCTDKALRNFRKSERLGTLSGPNKRTHRQSRQAWKSSNPWRHL